MSYSPWGHKESDMTEPLTQGHPRNQGSRSVTTSQDSALATTYLPVPQFPSQELGIVSISGCWCGDWLSGSAWTT